ncbi:MAG: ABC transporter ATP-binding protein/permease [Defluviitaleaceae bacterium]|nr:ABC transporter ATP-binding protein/permease [Defluviitaleaceae bacterium]
MRKHIKSIFRGLKLISSFPKPILQSSAISAVVRAGIPFINIWFAAQILNELVGGRNQSRLTFLVILTIGLNLLGQVANRALEKWHDYCRANFWQLMSKLISDKMLTMDYIDAENPDIRQKQSDIWGHHNGMGFGLSRLIEAYDGLIQGIIRVGLSVAFAFTLFTTRTPEGSSFAFLDSVWAVIVVLLLLCISMFVAPYFTMLGGRVLANASEENNQGNRVFTFYFWTMIGKSELGKDIRIYNQQDSISRGVESYFKNSKWLALSKIVGRYQFISSFINHTTNGLIYLFVAMKAFAGAFGVGSIVQYVGAITQFANGFNDTLVNLGNMINNNPYAEKIFEFLDIPNEKYQGTLPVEKRDDTDFDIEFKDVSFKYPGSDTYALKNVSFKLEIGQRLAVVGMNGSGKTTMIKLLCRLYDPTEGEITLNGIDIKKYNYDEYMNIFGVVFQDFALLPFTLGQNVAASVDYDGDRAMKVLEDSGFDRRLESMPKGLDTYIYKNFEEDGVEVSGGEAQKIALARALYKNTPFIVLDEPTAALDPIAEYEIYTKFNEIVGEKTAVYISHRLSSCRFCDDIVVFHEGELIQRGSHEGLLADADGKYHELWNAQAQYYAVSA